MLDLARYCIRNIEEGSRLYYIWMLSLIVLIYLGVSPTVEQVLDGLVVTHMSDSTPWGFHIANFTFMIGVAAGGITVVMPAYVFKNKAMKEILVIGELLPICAVLMAVSFILADMGRPDRLQHFFPPTGIMNLPSSLLSFDVLVLNGYLFMNIALVSFALMKKYWHWNEGPLERFVFIPLSFVSIGWAIAIHVVTAFIFSTMVGRPYWNNPLAAPKFIATAVATGPAILIIVLQFVEWRFKYPVKPEVYQLFAKTSFFALGTSLIMLVSELVVELYTGSEHAVHARYLWLGQHGHDSLLVWSWGSTVLNVSGLLGLVASRFGKNIRILTVAAAMITVGIWAEKGMCFMIPAYVPNPLGEWIEYAPNMHEIRSVLSIWGIGLLLFSLLVKIAVPIMAKSLEHAEKSHAESFPTPTIPRIPSRTW